jgi:hypothetical protein
MMSVSKFDDTYQASLKAKEKLARRQRQRTRGGKSSRGKGTTKENFRKLKPEDEKQHSHHEKGGRSK